MKRRTTLAAAAAVATGFAALPRTAAAADITLTYAFFAPAKIFPGVQMNHWAEQLAKRTNGKVAVKTFPGGTLLSAKEMYDGVTKGVADIGLGSPSYDPGRFPLTSGASLPVGFPNATVASRTLWELTQEFKPKEFEPFKVIAVFTGEPGYIQSRAPIRSAADLKGMKLRAAGTAFIVVSHYLHLIESLEPDVVLRLHEGCIAEQGDLTLARDVARSGFARSPEKQAA